MIVFLLLLAQTTAPTPSPTPAPTPAPAARPAPVLGRSGPAARSKTLSEHAAEMKAKGTPASRVSFDDVPSVEIAVEDDATDEKPGAAAGARSAANPAGKADDVVARKAQKRMDRAVERGLEVPERTRSPRRDKARKEWDDAAESCRQTPGCVPVYRDDPRWGDKKPLRTDAELIEEIRRRGFSEPHPIRK